MEKKTIKENLQSSKERIVLGLDPGTNVMGYAIILIKVNQLTLLQYGVINMGKYGDHALKLKKIFDRVLGLVDEYKPDEVALEAPFFGKNVQSMLKLGRAQGVAMSAAIHNNIPIVEYLPKVVKKSVVGNGNAAKEQVAAMLGHILGRPIEPSYYDASDALALAVCHFYQTSNMLSKGKKSDTWKAFMQDNPKRVVK